MDVIESRQFRKDKKQSIKRHQNQKKLDAVLYMLRNGEKLPEKYHDHPLQGLYKNYKECHIEPDWLLIYKIEDDTLYLAGTGSHADLFG